MTKTNTGNTFASSDIRALLRGGSAFTSLTRPATFRQTHMWDDLAFVAGSPSLELVKRCANEGKGQTQHGRR